MRLIIDANVVLAAILGRGSRIARALEAGIVLIIPEAQFDEAKKVLVRKFGVSTLEAHLQVNDTTSGIDVIETASLQIARDAALARLGRRGQPDWPVLAAAMLLDADIWSDDRDFFGVGVAVWWRNTIGIAIARAAAA